MDPVEVRLVQESFRLIAPIREPVAALFYARLFEIDASARGLFAGLNLKSQGGKLMAAIAAVVHALDAPDSMLDEARVLGRRHVRYGVKERHYESVGAALLWTLEIGLGERFTPDVRAAWAAAYGLLSGTMIDAARDEATALSKRAA